MHTCLSSRSAHNLVQQPFNNCGPEHAEDPRPKEIRVFYEKLPDLVHHFRSNGLMFLVTLDESANNSILSQLNSQIFSHFSMCHLHFTSTATDISPLTELQYERLPWCLLVGGNQQRQRDSQLVNLYNIQTYAFTIATLIKVSMKLPHPLTPDAAMIMLGNDFHLFRDFILLIISI